MESVCISGAYALDVLAVSMSNTATGCDKYWFLDKTISRLGLTFTQLKWLKRNPGCYKGFHVVQKVDSDTNILVNQTRVEISGFREFQFHTFLKRVICAILLLLIFTYVKHRSTIDKFSEEYTQSYKFCFREQFYGVVSCWTT